MENIRLNAVALVKDFLRRNVRPGAFCIDATAGRGHDTVMLAELAGENGKVLAFDVQQEAIDSTRALLAESGLTATLILDSHANMLRYAKVNSVDCIVFNFGWLPGGDHNIFTSANTSVQAVEQGLSLLKPDGVMSLCLYYGRNNGYTERDSLLEYIKSLDPSEYTAILCSFYNRKGDVPFPVFIYKRG